MLIQDTPFSYHLYCHPDWQKEKLPLIVFLHGAGERGDTPEELLVALEQNTELKAFIDDALSGYEKKVLSLYLTKKSYVEIAEKLGKTEKNPFIVPGEWQAFLENCRTNAKDMFASGK